MQQEKQGHRGQRGCGCKNHGEGQSGEGCGNKNGHKHQQGAKTFRRVRAINFLESMYVKRDTLKEQLNSPELQSINSTLVGELKAIEMVISEFSQVFEIHEFEELEEIE